MLPKPLTLIALVAVVVALTGALFVWDASRADVVSAGVRVGAVDVGGLARNAARARLHTRLLAPLDRPLVLTADDRTFTLTAREAQISANIDAIVDEAVARGRAGGILARTWRAVTGQGVDVRTTPDIRYSRRAVQRTVDRIRVAVTQAPVDAKVDFKPDSLVIRPAQAGRTIDARRLRRELETALVSDLGTRTLAVPVQTVAPTVSGEHLADAYPVVLTVDRGRFRLTLFKKLRRARIYRIAVGRVGLETPAGLYKIQNKAKNPAWHVPNSDWAGDLAGKVIPGGAPDNPIKARWLGIYDGVGVHGTDARGSIGTNASHGCIRMLVEDVEKLYDEVPIGTPIFIH